MKDIHVEGLTDIPKTSMRGKRIVIVLGTLGLGGTERQAIHLARYLKICDATVQVWSLGISGEAVTLCEESGLDWRNLPVRWYTRQSSNQSRVRKLVMDLAYTTGVLALYNAASLLRLSIALRRARPNIVLPYTMKPNVMCALAWRFAGAKLCVWNQRDEGRHFLGHRIERLASRQVKGYVANAQIGADFLTSYYKVDPTRIRVIHNGIELAPPIHTSDWWREQLGLDTDCFVGCMIANLHKYKDQATLLEAWRLVVDRSSKDVTRPVLLLAGNFAGTQDVLKAQAFDLGLCEHVRFLGHVKDISGLLTVVDLGVFSSRREGCPNGVLECMAAGLPVVATDIPGIREAVGDAGYSYLAQPGDAQELAEKILLFYHNRDLRDIIGTSNQARIQQEFTIAQMCRQTVEYITSLW